jgi:hypothetical protein
MEQNRELEANPVIHRQLIVNKRERTLSSMHGAGKVRYAHAPAEE